jgi:hypothetical protein
MADATQPGKTAPAESRPSEGGLSASQRMEGLSAPKALVDGLTDGLIVAVPSNEAPLQGLAGIIDWRFHGQVSAFHSLNPSNETLRGSQGLSGKLGEMTLMALQHHGKIFRVLFVGIGPVPQPGIRSEAVLQTLSRPLITTLMQLGWRAPGFSSQDWGDIELASLTRALEGRNILLFD